MKISGMVLVGKHEPYLEYCLKSIKDICDEIITISPYGANVQFVEGQSKVKMNRVKNLKQDSTDNIEFAKWRNQVLDAATGDWILWLDADEILAWPDGSNLKRKDIEEILKAQPDKENFLFSTLHFMYNFFTLDGRVYNMQTKQPEHKCMRLFKNDGRRFERKVHEYIPMEYEKSILVRGPLIWHFGHCKGQMDLVGRYRERFIRENCFTGHMDKKEFGEHLKNHHVLRGRMPLIRYDGPLPKVLGLW